eukprot:SAG22_NODE_429_length_10587_cov_22.842582_5_plen_68_part_00
MCRDDARLLVVAVCRTLHTAGVHLEPKRGLIFAVSPSIRIVAEHTARPPYKGVAPKLARNMHGRFYI